MMGKVRNKGAVARYTQTRKSAVMISKVSNTAIHAISKAATGMQKEAGKIATSTAPDSQTNITESLVKMKQHARETEANAQVLKYVDNMIGSLLDEKA